jgi:hypothetical protein
LRKSGIRKIFENFSNITTSLAPRLSGELRA